MRLSAALVVMAFAAAPATAEVVVRVSGGHVDLTATAAPLADVLDRLARQTGMKVVYEGPAPRQLVTLSLRGRTPTETVLSVFEGLGVNFALVADPSGSRVQTLVVAGTATASSSPSSAAAGRAPSPPSGRRPSAHRPGRARRPSTPVSRKRTRSPRRKSRPSRARSRGRRSPIPAGSRWCRPTPTPANPAAQAPSVPPGFNAQPMPRFPSSPFTPQPQPFPPQPVVVPAAPAGSPPPEEGAPPVNPPPP